MTDTNVPNVHQPAVTPHPKLDELIGVLHQLRAEGGCAWDRDQTPASLVKYLIEETYELVEAIESGSHIDLIEELGDVLYQIIFHADIAAEAGAFDLEDVAAKVTAKMIGRHPHVFSDTTADSVEEVIAVWDRAKALEKSHRTSVLDGIPLGMPSLALADKLLSRAERVGVIEVSGGGGTNAAAPIPLADEQQLGALLLAIVSSARAGGLDAERALRATLRELQNEIREAEATVRPATVPTALGDADSPGEDPANPTPVYTDPFDAGVIGFGSERPG